MLADYRDDEGRPTCGLRLHIPGYLMSSFKILEQFGYYLRQKHNGELTKYIKFDEHDHSLFLQVRHKKETDWITFNVEQAKIEMAKNNNLKPQRSRLLSDTTEAAAGSGTLPSISDSMVASRNVKKAGEDGKKAPGTPTWRPPMRMPSTSTGKFVFPERPAAKRTRDEEARMGAEEDDEDV